MGISASAEDAGKDITVMLYMCGSNLESETGAASRDLKEIVRSKYDSERVNVLAMTGGSCKWWSGFETDETAIYDLGNKKPVKVHLFLKIAKELNRETYPVYSGICQDIKSFGRVGEEEKSGAL